MSSLQPVNAHNFNVVLTKEILDDSGAMWSGTDNGADIGKAGQQALTLR